MDKIDQRPNRRSDKPQDSAIFILNVKVNSQQRIINECTINKQYQNSPLYVANLSNLERRRFFYLIAKYERNGLCYKFLKSAIYFNINFHYLFKNSKIIFFLYIYCRI